MHFKAHAKLRKENNVSQMMSFLPNTHSEPLLKVLHRNIFCGPAAISWRMESFRSSIVRGLLVYTLHLRYPHKKSCKSMDQGNVGAKKHRRNGRSNVGGTGRRQTHDAVRSNAPWLLKLHCLSCPPAHAQRHQPHPCPVLAIWKTRVSSAPPCM